MGRIVPDELRRVKLEAHHLTIEREAIQIGPNASPDLLPFHARSTGRHAESLAGFPARF